MIAVLRALCLEAESLKTLKHSFRKGWTARREPMRTDDALA
jgi:hypothetical protein